MRAVLDASACVEFLLGTAAGRAVAGALAEASTIYAPELMISEVTSALRGLVRGGVISDAEARLALRDLRRLDVEWVSGLALLPSIWRLSLRHSTYDAHYVALAETVSGTLVTGDRRLASAMGEVPVILI
ncbi:MAG: type II toxin-antitoxin system VapC family toxin [Propioniciclava sp.]|uniref:type II toxin-antitoxin system VapC family toxin n=1 Tax=Propioniciclava sp. TaxID=2038686 RepID=UPI0039E694A8